MNQVEARLTPGLGHGHDHDQLGNIEHEALDPNGQTHEETIKPTIKSFKLSTVASSIDHLYLQFTAYLWSTQS